MNYAWKITRTSSIQALWNAAHDRPRYGMIAHRD